MDKRTLREEMRRRRATMTDAQLRAQSRDITAKLLSHPVLLRADVVLLYASLPDEVDTNQLLRELRDMGKKILLPVVVDDERMEVTAYQGDGRMREGAFHIKEPVGEPFTDYTAIGVAVVPGMAFDRKGNRLGRGKGYYDRFLARIPYTYIIGVCYDFQLLEEVPTENHDRKVDEVVSSEQSDFNDNHAPHLLVE